MTESTISTVDITNHDAARDQRGPLLTWLACAACVAIYFDLAQRHSSLQKTLFHLTTLPGNYCGLITSAFTHTQLWHLFFNVYWLWILGGLLEREIGRLNWIVFFVLSAIVSSGAQAMVTGHTGIGASGVVYAMFGFIWIARKRYPGFEAIATKQNIALFLGWLVFCVIATYVHILSIGNAAHVSGLLFGVGVAYLGLRRAGQDGKHA